MGVHNQLSKLKSNWLIVLLVAVALLVTTCSGPLSDLGGSLTNAFTAQSAVATEKAYGTGGEAAYAPGFSRSIYPPVDEGFAPGEQDRKIVKSSSLSTEVEDFPAAEGQVKSIVQSSGAYLLGQNAYTSGEPGHQYKTGNYNIKVEAGKYDAVVAQLMQIGKVASFQESATDVTGQAQNLALEIEAEKARLARYNEMYMQATLIEDKISLNDRIFDQERSIKYLEERQKNLEQEVEYSSIYVTISEKKPDYVDVAFVKLTTLVKSVVASINALLIIIAVLFPFAVVAAIGWLIYWLVRR